MEILIKMSKILPLIELQDVDTQLRDINELLGDLPEESINNFAQSDEFEIYKIIGERYG